MKKTNSTQQETQPDMKKKAAFYRYFNALMAHK